MCYFYRDPVTEDLVLVPPWPEHSLFSDPKPSLRRYWTFHALCRGWIEFIYDHENNEWSVAHGAREVGDEEVAMHGHGEAPSAHELLRGLFVDFMREGSSPRGYSTATEWEDWADLPTRDTFYRNAGWLCE
ncbi:hypothetical protein K458DRAFT_412699 [Lentithecium fluviatile CBS 122367]|uniref:Uncharacterized protein n=1 Tax=Lentithecium fluviatile CBS 122367 TaxID=1168545 RepID=A0A6G1JI72_9PLEO|nr:hypothetical protein K458DRAFT_412699 [Lentithecium fluviatile CBS 122367]